MFSIIDRRQQGGKSHVNVERFKRKYDTYIREAAKRALENAGITGETKGQDITIPKGDMREPVFGHDSKGGTKEMVHPGNTEFYKGDKIARPEGGKGKGSGQGEGADDFIYHVDSQTIENIWFGDLGLPFSFREHVATDKTKFRRSGIVTSGTPNNRDIVRTAKAAMGRRMVQNHHIRNELNRLTEEFDAATDEATREALLPEIERFKGRHAPYLDPMDERFRNRERVPVKESRAVMFAMMDVSMSMDDNAKYMSRLYFTFLYRFLNKQYDRVEVVFVRYHDKARVCADAQDFFHGKDSGGTSVTNALHLVENQVETKFNPNEWDIFCAQAGDGDTGHKEDHTIRAAMANVMGYCRYFTNLVVAPAGKTKELEVLYRTLEPLYEGRLATKHASDPKEILPVFRQLFKAKTGVPLSQMSDPSAAQSFAMPAVAP